MGERKTKLAEGRVRLLKEAIERLVNYGVRADSLLEEVLGKRGLTKFEKYRHAFTDNELCFMSITLDRDAIPFAPFDPFMLYRYRHYSLKLYSKDLDKLAIVACEHLLTGLSKKLSSVDTLLDRDLEALGFNGTRTILRDGKVVIWVHQVQVTQTTFLTSQCAESNYSSKLPFTLQTSLEQIFHAAQIHRRIQCQLGLK